MKEKVKALERHNFHNHGFKNCRFHLKPTQDVLFVLSSSCRSTLNHSVVLVIKPLR